MGQTVLHITMMPLSGGESARSAKPRGSLADAIQARSDCIPCRAASRAIEAAEPPGDRLKVGLWAPNLALGGAEDWMRTLVRAADHARIAWRGLAVTCGATQADARVVADYAESMPVVYGDEGARAVAAESDVVVQWGVKAGLRFVQGLRRKPKVVGVLHWNRECGYADHFYDQPGCADAFVAVSELAVDAAPAWYTGSVPVIGNAVDPERLKASRSREEMRASWGVPDGAKVLGFLGRLDPEQKDPMAVVRVLPFLSEDWHAVIVGEGPDFGALRNALATHPRLHLPGGDRDAGSVLGAFDALVVPSAWESFGLSLCEGLWCGVPVISTRVGVCKLVDGLTREIPVHADGPTIAGAVLADQADVEGTAARVDHARRWARETLGPERFGAAWTDFLTSISGAKR